MAGLHSNQYVVWHDQVITRVHRENMQTTTAIKSYRSKLIWFTGLPSSGKSTLANAVEKHLYEAGVRTFVLDGDNIRHGLCKDLGFSLEDRAENIRRAAEVAKLFVEAGVVTLAAFISPLRSERERLRHLFKPGDYIEIFCDCPISVCEKRDAKGMYKMARNGLISDFTGISSLYEAPQKPDLRLNTATMSVDECVDTLITFLDKRNRLSNTIQPHFRQE
ncbi:adenylyl-sulfate kinase [Beggiatoa alba]|nr:adenylyl-sulfate kinase [Beggiatoa alba]